MLDTETKRRINTCRDILVGKVPDPKSQVEQITIALIYKFMDDMDLEAEEMGFARKFFTGEYERYAWAKLVAPSVGGQEMLNIYTEALTKMVQNPDIPELFRSIFRNAYLPYRDPETLRSFLREINGFSYDHSERLGDAFEYLLSVLGSQGDAGQFRTPRHIIDFMVEIIDPKKEEVILDPACGTAGFLISSYKHILKANSTDGPSTNTTLAVVDAAEAALESPLRFSGDLLTPEDRQRMANQIKGYDISPDMVRLSLVNLYLHGFADPKVEEYDTLTSEDKWGQTADVILANPPFMSPKGGIKPHNRFGVPSKRSEVLFVDYIAEHLTPSGRAAIVVPEGIIFQSQSAYVALRRMLVTKHLAAVISLPAGVFNPYSGVKTSILILDRAVAKASDSVAFFKIENDGFGLGAQRRAVKGGQLEQVKAGLGAWLAAVRNGRDAALESPLGFAVEKARIAEGGEYNLSGERYRETVVNQSTYEIKSLGDICDGIFTGPFGTSLHETDYVETGVPVVNPKNILAGSVISEGAKMVSLETVHRLKEFTLRKNDIVIARRGEMGRCAVIEEKMDGWLCGTGCFFIRVSRQCDTQYVFHQISSSRSKAYLEEQAVGVTMMNLNQGILAALKIPLPPLEVQREIVAEIEGYQKVIDGARAVLENYRPHIPIDKAWGVAELGSLCKPEYGFTASAEDAGDARLVRITDISEDGKLRAENQKYTTISNESSWALLENGDILLARTGATFGKTMIFEAEYPAIFASYLIRLKFDPKVVVPRFYWAFAQSESYWSQANALMTGGGQPQFNGNAVKQIKIPLPPLETQKAIVAEIEAEQALVNATRELIARFEKKIEASIARVWSGAEEAIAA